MEALSYTIVYIILYSSIDQWSVWYFFFPVKIYFKLRSLQVDNTYILGSNSMKPMIVVFIILKKKLVNGYVSISFQYQ